MTKDFIKVFKELVEEMTKLNDGTVSEYSEGCVLNYSDVKKALKEVIEQGEMIQNVKSPIHLNKILKEMYNLKENKVLTLEEAKKEGYRVYSFRSKDYMYEDEKGTQYLIRGEEVLCQGVFVYSFSNKDYMCKDEKGTYHLFRDGKPLCKGRYVWSYDDGDYTYEDKDGTEHYCKIIDDEVWERK